ncbi:MAG: hypothetical protein LBT25_02600 [Candidatus Symbiothrix sp.]|jgi:hypothetical protein|nr:hypothetical protein [Candidatus Symbiothrix sp.]
MAQNAKKKSLAMLLAFLALTLLVSCGGDIGGTFIPKNEIAKKQMFTKFVFSKRGTVKCYMGMPSMPQIGTAYEIRYTLEGTKLSLEGGIPGINGASFDFQYDKAKNEISLFQGMLGTEGAIWGKEGTFDPNQKDPIPPVNLPKEPENNNEGTGVLNKIKDFFSSKPKDNAKKQFDRSDIAYVYIINDSKATAIHAGHNFIAFEDENGNGAVYSYGPVESRMDYHARIWIGTFSNFENALKQQNFSLSAQRLAVVDSTKKITSIVHWKNDFNKYEYYYGKEYCYGTANQAFDRYVKFLVTKEEGEKMIDYADLYLSNHPQYGVLVPGKKVGQCDNMTSEIAGAGGLGYVVLNTPNFSFNNILDWGQIRNRYFIKKYPSE